MAKKSRQDKTPKKRNHVVRQMITNPKRNAGRHRTVDVRGSEEESWRAIWDGFNEEYAKLLKRERR